MIMKVEKEMKYEAPEVEVLEVVVEKGFAASGDFNDGDTEDAQPTVKALILKQGISVLKLQRNYLIK